MSKDRQVTALLTSGLLAQALAVGLGFTSLGWTLTIAGACVLIAAGAAAAVPRFSVFALGAAALAAWHVLSPSTPAAGAVRIVFALEALGQIALLIFLKVFRLKRLW